VGERARIFSILRRIAKRCNEKLRKYEPLSHWRCRLVLCPTDSWIDSSQKKIVVIATPGNNHPHEFFLYLTTLSIFRSLHFHADLKNFPIPARTAIFRNYDQKKQCPALWLWVILLLLIWVGEIYFFDPYHFNSVIFQSYSA
jgi:hypothetical protein